MNLRKRAWLVLLVCALLGAFFVFQPSLSPHAQGGWSQSWDFTSTDGAFVPNTWGVYVAGVGWKTTVVSGDSVSLLMSRTFTSSTITYAEVTTCWTSAPFGGGAGTSSELYYGGSVVATISANDIHSGCRTHTWSGSVTANLIRMNPDGAVTGGSSGAGYAVVTHALLIGTGSNPFSTPPTATPTPTVTPTPGPVIDEGWAFPIRMQDRDANYNAVYAAERPFFAYPSGFGGLDVNYMVSNGRKDVHAVQEGIVISKTAALDDCREQSAIYTLDGFCLLDITVAVPLAGWYVSRDAVLISVQMPDLRMINYLVTNPTVEVGDEIRMGCVLGQTVEARFAQGFGAQPTSSEIIVFQGLETLSPFDLTPLLSAEPLGGRCTQDDTACALVNNPTFTGTLDIIPGWQTEPGLSGQSVTAVPGGVLLGDGAIFQQLNLNPLAQYSITARYKNAGGLTAGLVVGSFAITLGTTTHEIDGQEGAGEIGWAVNPQVYTPNETVGTVNIYDLRLQATSNPGTIIVTSICVSDEDAAAPSTTCLLHDYEMEDWQGELGWTKTGDVAIGDGLAFAQDGSSLSQELHLFPKDSGDQDYTISVKARRSGEPTGGEAVLLDWSYNGDSGTFSSWSDRNYKVLTDTFTVSSESTDDIAFTVDASGSPTNPELEIDSICITTSDGTQPPGYAPQPIITAVCRTCAFVPTGDVAADLAEFVRWLFCFISQLWECQAKTILMGIWSVLTQILTFMGFMRAWLTITVNVTIDYIDSAIVIVAAYFNGLFRNLLTGIENALYGRVFQVTTSGAGFFDVLLEIARQIGNLLNGIVGGLRDAILPVIHLLQSLVDGLLGLASVIIQLIITLLSLVLAFVVSAGQVLVSLAANTIGAIYAGFNAASVQIPIMNLQCTTPGEAMYYPCLGLYILDNTIFAGPVAYVLPVTQGAIALHLLLWTLKRINRVFTG